MKRDKYTITSFLGSSRTGGKSILITEYNVLKGVGRPLKNINKIITLLKERGYTISKE